MKVKHLFYYLTLSIISLLVIQPSLAGNKQIRIPTIEQMPNLPQPYNMRNWEKVARDYDGFVFSFDKKGKFLPLISWAEGFNQNKSKTFAIPSYVGLERDDFESITCLGAVNGATVAGIDKSAQKYNWVKFCGYYFKDKNNINLYINNSKDTTGATFWYELFPNILFYRIYNSYPGTANMDEQFTNVADRWHQACVAMDGKTDPWTVPDFDHTAFDFETMKPVDNSIWKEPGAAGAIAWLEYMAYTETGNEKYLTAAKWALDFLEQREENPYYEILLPHGVYTAARMNAEEGTSYDVEKLFKWCFDGTNPRRWGVTSDRWGKYDCSGLVGSVRKGSSYAFAMNTFNLANSFVPLVRYDERFARAVGKWMLNAANSARLLYANALPAENQTDKDWVNMYDPNSCIAYEGLQQTHIEYDRIAADIETKYGKTISSSYRDTYFTNKEYQVFGEEYINGKGKLRHTWKAKLTPAKTYTLSMVGKCTSSDNPFIISYAADFNGPYTRVYQIDSISNQQLSSRIETDSSKIFIRVESSNPTTKLNKCFIDDIYVRSNTGKSPYATGDAKSNSWGNTNLGLYGSSFAGIFGGIISQTNVKGILKLDCLATDYFNKNSNPTYLLYNPYDETKVVNISLDHKSDIYDTVNKTYIEKEVSESVPVSISPDSARIIVITPVKNRDFCNNM